MTTFRFKILTLSPYENLNYPLYIDRLGKGLKKKRKLREEKRDSHNYFLIIISLS